MIQYIYNTETESILYNATGEWGARYVESTGTFPGVDTFKAPWRVATQPEIDASILSHDKIVKIYELNNKFAEWVTAGVLFDNYLFDLSSGGLSNIKLKNSLPLTAPNRFKYWTLPDENGVETHHDFGDEAAWVLFFNAITIERDRIMNYKNEKRTEINLAATPEAVAAITINFSP